MRKILKMALALILVYLLVITTVYFYQDKLIFQSVGLDKDYQFEFTSPFEELWITTEDNVQINALYFKTDKPVQGVILYFHGNADNLQRWGQYAGDFTSLGYDVLMVDYRGFGKSTGKPNEQNLYIDAEYIWQWAHKKYNYDKWVIYGRSLGASVASYLASKTDPDLLGLETPFDDLNGASFASLIPFKLKYKFANKSHLKNVTCKKFIYHGTQDWVVPLSSALRLKPLLNDQDQMVIVPNAGHKNLRKFDLYHKKLRDLLL
jgi:uncharacterized protein